MALTNENGMGFSMPVAPAYARRLLLCCIRGIYVLLWGILYNFELKYLCIITCICLLTNQNFSCIITCRNAQRKRGDIMYEVPDWSVKVQTKMIKTGMTKKELAAKIGCNYTQLVNVMSGLVKNEKIETDIKRFFEKKGEKKNV